LKLIDSTPDDVVCNAKNHSHYRFAGPEKSRARIRPLELFPNGLLIPKPTDTIVDPTIEVHRVGPWHEGMLVEGRPDHSRAKYEAELAEKQALLIELQEQYDMLPQAGTGKKSRGSWANKIKNCAARVETLQAGLAQIDQRQRERTQVEVVSAAIQAAQLVQLPSGRPARVQAITGGMALVACRYQGGTLTTALPTEVLRPWSMARVATV